MIPKEEQTHNKAATASGVHSGTWSMSMKCPPDCSWNGQLVAGKLLWHFLDDTCFPILFLRD